MAMVTVRQLRLIGSKGGRKYGFHPHMKFQRPNRDVIIVPYAPRVATRSGGEATFAEVERPGRMSVLEENGRSIPQLSFTLVVGFPDHQRPVEYILDDIEHWAADGVPVRVLNMGPGFAGWWKITQASVTSQMRQHGTNLVTRATVQITLKRTLDDIKLRPRGGRGGGGGGGGGGNRPQFYVVKRGDTLSEIALRFYDDADQWPRIARANNITNPRRQVKVGMRLRIP